MSKNLWRALAGRTALVAISALTLTGLMISDQIAQPETIHVPGRSALQSEDTRR